jgi:hypothetical protein
VSQPCGWHRVIKVAYPDWKVKFTHTHTPYRRCPSAIASIISIKNLHNTIAPASQHVKECHSASGDGRKCRTVPHVSPASNCAGGLACRSIFGGRHCQPEHLKKIPQRLHSHKKPTASSLVAAPMSAVSSVEGYSPQ